MPIALCLCLMVFCGMAASPSAWAADEPTSKEVLSLLPVREITVFKDGHAFVVHQGKLAVEKGQIHLDQLPMPVLGTFWPFVTEPGVKVSGVTASQRRVNLAKTALRTQDLLEANVGSDVIIHEDKANYKAKIVSILARSAEELEATALPGSGPRLPEKGSVILLKTDQGTKVVHIDTIRDVTFVEPPKTTLLQPEFRNQLTLQVTKAAGDKELAGEVSVGLMYIQKGMRWIPEYQVLLRDNGMADVRLQATLVNDLTDLEHVSLHLVVGVPQFDMGDQIDPIALNQMAAQVAVHMDLNNNFSNGAMNFNQIGNFDNRRVMIMPAEQFDPGPRLGADEDLFVFDLKDVSLRKGERMVLPIGEWTVPFEDIFRVELPIAPPPEVARTVDPNRQHELERMRLAPKVKRNVRLKNKTPVPFTTAPVLFLKNERVLSQGTMTYTSPGNQVDVPLSTTINIPLSHEEREVKRTAGVEKWRGELYDRIDQSGTISLTNFRDTATKVEIVRSIVGAFDKVSEKGEFEKLTNQFAPVIGNQHFHELWYQLNSVSRARWNVEIAPGATTEVTYSWHYFWR